MVSPIPEKQKALFLLKAQGNFEVREVDVPKPGPGEVLIREEGVGLNPVDYVTQQTGMFVKEYPFLSGWEGAGVVVGLGEGVHDVSIGDRVGHFGHIGTVHATYQQYTTFAADMTFKIPSNVNFDSAAAIPATFTTAALALYAQPAENGGAGLIPPWQSGGLRKYADKPILVLGGSSSVGQFAIQLARLSGFSPIITTASLKNTEYLKGLGATHVLDRKLDVSSAKSAVRQISSKPFDVVFDAVSHEDTQEIGYDILAPGGTLIIDTSPKVPESKITPDKRIALIYCDPTLPDRRDLAAEMYKRIPAFFASGELKPNRVEVVPNGLAGIQDGLARLGRGELSATKLVARPQETS